MGIWHNSWKRFMIDWFYLRALMLYAAPECQAISRACYVDFPGWQTFYQRGIKKPAAGDVG